MLSFIYGSFISKYAISLALRKVRIMKKFSFPFASILLITSMAAHSQGKMDFEKYEPVSTLKVPEHKVNRAKFPFIDVHNHQRNMSSADIQKLLKEMDQLNMAVMVNLSGGSGNSLNEKVQNIRSAMPKRFIVFANVEFTGVGAADWANKAVKQLEADVKNGANGLKVFKNLGFSA